jgi:peptidoglycan/LPS O-acetylase OafA/YrhL
MLPVMLLSMRVAVTIFVALLTLHFVDEQLNDARYTRASKSMLSAIARSFG